MAGKGADRVAGGRPVAGEGTHRVAGGGPVAGEGADRVADEGPVPGEGADRVALFARRVAAALAAPLLRFSMMTLRCSSHICTSLHGSNTC